MTLAYRQPPEQPFVNVLLYGPPKTGKTMGACSAPGRKLIINCDLPNATWQAHQLYGDSLREVEWRGRATLVDVALAVEAGEFDTVIVDPVGDLHRLLLEEVSNRAVRPHRNLYGDVGVQVERFCRWLCEAPINAIIVAHELPVENDGSLEKQVFTGTSNPRVGEKVTGMVDIIGYTGIIEREDGEEIYAATLRPGGGRRGGDRFSTLGPWRAVDLTQWFEEIGAHLGTTGATAGKG